MKYVKYLTSAGLFVMAASLVYGLVPTTDPLAFSKHTTHYNLAVSSVEQFNNVLSTSSKPVLVVVHANWCPWCNKMTSEMKSNPDEVAKLKEYTVVSVDLTGSGNTAVYKEVTKGVGGAGLPFVAKYVNGHRVNTSNGYLSPEALLRF